MEFDIVEEAKKFLKFYLAGMDCEYEQRHSWRKSSEYIILHSYRVYSIAMKLVEDEKLKLSEDDILLIKVSAILHDIGKRKSRENHAESSAKVAQEWINKNSCIKFQIKDVERLLYIIRNHSNKDEVEKDLCAAIVKDADILDEIGVLSIFMSSNVVDRNSPYFFNDLKTRLEEFELNYCDEVLKKLNTEMAKRILEHKKNFIKAFIENLEMELEGTEDLYKEVKSEEIEFINKI